MLLVEGDALGVRHGDEEMTARCRQLAEPREEIVNPVHVLQYLEHEEQVERADVARELRIADVDADRVVTFLPQDAPRFAIVFDGDDRLAPHQSGEIMSRNVPKPVPISSALVPAIGICRSAINVRSNSQPRFG